ncbi:hypothetical protein ACOMHN_014912 [Nucella lapillus]
MGGREGRGEGAEGSLVFGPGSLTQGQLVALTSVTLVVLLLLTANIAVYWIYRRTVGQEERKRRRERKSKADNLWVYHMHRTSTLANATTESASQQILRKLQKSHHNLQAKLAATSADSSYSYDDDNLSLRREEAQALEELEVTTDLFRHERGSCSSSRRSSLSGVGSSRKSTARKFLRGMISRGRVFSSSSSSSKRRRSSSEGRSAKRDPGSTLYDLDPGRSAQCDPPSTMNDLDPVWDFETPTTTFTRRSSAAAYQDEKSAVEENLDRDPAEFAAAAASRGDLDLSYDFDVAAALADLDMASALHDLDPESDKVSMTSVTFADFLNEDSMDFFGSSEQEGKKKARSSNRRRNSSSSSRGSSHDKGDQSRSLPVAEFHNEAFDFTETRTAVERVKDVEL